MIRSNTAQLRLPLDDQVSWDIFNSYAENREDEKSSGYLSTHWTSADGDGFPMILEPGPVAAVSAVDDPYYHQSAGVVQPINRSRFSLDDEARTHLFKSGRHRKQNMTVDAGRDADGEDEGLKAILSAAHSQASKSKRAFEKFISNLAHHRNDEEMENSRKFCLKSALGDAQSSQNGYFHFVASSPQPSRPVKMRRTKSEFEGEIPKDDILRETPALQISSPLLVLSSFPSPPPLGRATTFVRRIKALPLRPSPIPAI